MIEEQNPSSVSAFISVRGRIRKEMGKDGNGEAGIENRGKGTPSPKTIFLQRKVKHALFKQTQFLIFRYTPSGD